MGFWPNDPAVRQPVLVSGSKKKREREQGQRCGYPDSEHEALGWSQMMIWGINALTMDSELSNLPFFRPVTMW
jgi:hypothetical protein